MDEECKTLIRQYIEKFDEGPPIFGMEIEEAIKRMKDALATGEEMEGLDVSDLPPDAYL